jgi:ABC-type multidrug transport system fused ATPase/permease subunit
MISALVRFFPAGKLIKPLLRSHEGLIARFAATAIGRSVMTILNIFLIQNTLAGLLGEESRFAQWMLATLGQTVSLLLAVAVLLVINFATVWCRYDNLVTQQRLIKVLEVGLLERLVRHLLTFSARFFQRQTPGDLLHALREDITWLRVSLGAFAMILLEGILVLCLVSTLIWLSPWMSLWALCILPVGSLPIVYLIKQVRQRSFILRRTQYVLSDLIIEMILGIRIIKAYQAEEREAQIAVSKANQSFDEAIEQIRFGSLANGLMELLTGIGLVVVIMVGSYHIIHGTLVWADLLAFLLALRGINTPIHNLGESVLEIQKSRASVRRISELLDTPTDLVTRPDAVSLDAAPQKITFDQVSFSYGDAPILRNVNFVVAAGETVVIVGPSGAGKSTLLNLIARFYDPTSGRVLYDGRDLREFRLTDIYARVAVVDQEPFLFAASVRENIRAGKPEATDFEVEAAAQAAYIHEEIVQLQEGYDTALGIGGRPLSRGQSQRINLARAFLKDAPILLLDEATSSLDAVAELQVQKAIDRLMQGRTSFFVTHKLATVEHSDRIILVDENRCATIGKHHELYRDFAMYRRMWEMTPGASPQH